MFALQVPDAAAIDCMYAADVYTAAPANWPPLPAYRAECSRADAVSLSMLPYECVMSHRCINVYTLCVY